MNTAFQKHIIFILKNTKTELVWNMKRTLKVLLWIFALVILILIIFTTTASFSKGGLDVSKTIFGFQNALSTINLPGILTFAIAIPVIIINLANFLLNRFIEKQKKIEGVPNLEKRSLKIDREIAFAHMNHRESEIAKRNNGLNRIGQVETVKETEPCNNSYK
jgi:hypothetical protein